MGPRRGASVLGAVVALCGFASAPACGLTEDGTADVAPDAAPGGSVCNPPACALPSSVAGWRSVLFANSRVDACPSGYATADAVEGLTAGPTSCTCGACVPTGTDCAIGPSSLSFDRGDGTCAAGELPLNILGDRCVNNPFNASVQLTEHTRITAPATTLGTCTSAAAADTKAAATKVRRLCTAVTATCAGSACSAPASMRACLAAKGDLKCPPETPTKHLIGQGRIDTCPACVCTVASATCSGAVDLFPDVDCGGTPKAIAAETCTNTQSVKFKSSRWKSSVSNIQCTTVPAAAVVTLSEMETVCCP